VEKLMQQKSCHKWWRNNDGIWLLVL